MVSPAPVRANAGTKGVPRVQRESQILDHATEIFGTVGFAGTNLQTIADAAGISKPLIYNYFGSKEGLFAACLEHAGTVLGSEVERIARGDAVGLERGLKTLAGMFTVLEPQPYLWRLLHDPTAPSTGTVAATITAHTARLAALAHEGVSELMHLDGNDDALDISAMTATWLGIVDSLMTWWVDHPHESAESMVQRCRRLVAAIIPELTRET